MPNDVLEIRDDLEEVAAGQDALWRSLDHARLFITGATGFFGKWLLALVQHARAEHALDIEVTILSRVPRSFPGVRVIVGDVRAFSPAGPFTHVIHGATASGSLPPAEMHEVVVDGTRRVLDLGADRVLYVSSGSVYGPQPSAMTHLSEEHSAEAASADEWQKHRGVEGYAYDQAKRVAENLCLERADHVSIARGFSFCAPFLPLDLHFAIGNFIRDGLTNTPIRIRGDGTPYRSYMYGSDLAFWLLAMLARGENGTVYNVGSDDGRPLSAIASEVARQTGVAVEIAQTPTPGAPISRYVPSIERAKKLGLSVTVPLEEAIRRTIAFHRRA